MHTKYSGQEIFEMLRERSHLKSEIESYFHFDSPLKRAIVDHINDSKDCAIVKREGDIPCHRGTGPDIRFREWHARYDQLMKDNKTFRPPDYVTVEVYVGYYDAEENREWQRRYDLVIPLDLLTNFSKERFEAWVAKLREKRDGLQETKDLDILKVLVKRYPKHAKEYLE